MKIGVIADDLTGANSTGVCLNKLGFNAATLMQSKKINESGQYNVICIDTDTRYAPSIIVKNRVNKAFQNLHDWGATLFCKRIDSTFRGNIGLEIDLVLSNLGEDSVAIVLASFPESDRITVGGYLIVNGMPLQESDVSKDSLKPVKESYIPTIIQRQTENKVKHIGLDSVLKGKEKFKEILKSTIHDRNRIIVVDAMTEDDIEIIGMAMADIRLECPSNPIVSVDPGPLSASFASAIMTQERAVQSNRIIVTLGSVTEISEKQLQYLKNNTASSPVYVSAEKLASFGDSWKDEIERGFEEAIEKIQTNEILIITTQEGRKLIDLQSKAKLENTTSNELAKRITDGLAEITKEIIDHSRQMVKGCFTSGGDVTASLVSTSSSSGIELIKEISPLTAYGTMIGGDFPGLPIVTKGGMIGEEKTMYSCVRYIQKER